MAGRPRTLIIPPYSGRDLSRRAAPWRLSRCTSPGTAGPTLPLIAHILRHGQDQAVASLAAHTMARPPIPVLPLVASTTISPCFSSPFFSAARIMARVMRSFTLQPGLTPSTFASNRPFSVDDYNPIQRNQGCITHQLQDTGSVTHQLFSLLAVLTGRRLFTQAMIPPSRL